MKRLLLIGLVLTYCTPRLTAQVQIEHCYSLAEHNYPQARQYNIIERTSQYNLSNAAKGWLPQVQIGAKFSLQSDVTQLPLDLSALGFDGIQIPQLSKDQYNVTVDVSQAIYDGGSIKARQDMTKAEAETEGRLVSTTLYALRERVNQLFFGILLYDEQLRINALLQDDLKLQAGKIERYIENGIAHAADLDAVHVEQLKAEQQATNYNAYRQAYIDMLSLLTGEAYDSTTTFAQPGAKRNSTLQMTDNRRPELAYYNAQTLQLQAQERYLDTQLRPRFSIFAQGGYGRPGLDMLKNDFAPYGIIGARLTWNFSAFYTRKNDRRLIKTGMENIEAARATFLLNARIDAARQSAETRRLEALLRRDNDIISLRTAIKRASEAKMAGGTISGTDLMRDINAEQTARLDKALHEMQLSLAFYELKFTLNQ